MQNGNYKQYYSELNGNATFPFLSFTVCQQLHVNVCGFIWSTYNFPFKWSSSCWTILAGQPRKCKFIILPFSSKPVIVNYNSATQYYLLGIRYKIIHTIQIDATISWHICIITSYTQARFWKYHFWIISNLYVWIYNYLKQYLQTSYCLFTL